MFLQSLRELWVLVKPYLALTISIISLAVSFTVAAVNLRDRKSRLALRARRGDWCVVQSGTHIIFAGVIEAYNLSSRPNTIQDYFFWEQTTNGEWHQMESEFYTETLRHGDQERTPEGISNRTPLAIGPYSGAELRLRAITSLSEARELRVRVEVEDIFRKRHRVEVIARP